VIVSYGIVWPVAVSGAVRSMTTRVIRAWVGTAHANRVMRIIAVIVAALQRKLCRGMWRTLPGFGHCTRRVLGWPRGPRTGKGGRRDAEGPSDAMLLAWPSAPAVLVKRVVTPPWRACTTGARKLSRTRP